MSVRGESRPCSVCFEEHLLLVAVRLADLPAPPTMYLTRAGGLLDLCGTCWRALGEPRAPALSPVELAEVAARIREGMLRQGGNPRYMVRSGKA
jgi:hypothetical protein